MNGHSVPATLDGLEALVSEKAQESSHLEFKSSKAFNDLSKLKAELPRDASAFANAGGGVIVFGVEEDSDARAERIEGYKGTKITESWFEDVLINTINPIIPGVQVDCVEHISGKVFVLRVPLSLVAPHQSSDRKYYARRQFRRDDLEHFEIEMLRLRSASSDVGVFGGISINGYWLAAEVENKRLTPIYGAKFVFETQIPKEFQRSKVLDDGIRVIPARARIFFRLGTIHNAIKDRVMGSDLPYRFEFKLEPEGGVQSLIGRIHLSDLAGAAIAADEAGEIVSVLKSGFAELSSAFRGRARRP